MRKDIECDVQDLRRILVSGADCCLVDVREFHEYMKGRIAGARLIPLGDLARRVKEIDSNHRVYVICQAGVRSGMAQRKLRAMGFDNIINVVGGFKAWKSAGFPVEHG